MNRLDYVLMAWTKYETEEELKNYFVSEAVQLKHKEQQINYITDCRIAITSIQHTLKEYHNKERRKYTEWIDAPCTSNEGRSFYEDQLKLMPERKLPLSWFTKISINQFHTFNIGLLDILILLQGLTMAHKSLIKKNYEEIKDTIRESIKLQQVKELNTNSPHEEPTKDIPINPHPQIFKGKDDKAFRLFESLEQELVRDRFILADYSFIYRKMFDKKLINNFIKENHFRDWLIEIKTIDIGKLKLLDYCKTEQKEKTYFRLEKAIFNPKR